MNGPIPLSFCIVLYQDVRIERQVDRPLEEYLSAIRTADIAWIDCSTKDDTWEIEQIVQIAGFSKIPIPKLTTGFYSAYEDYDTELGIMLPSATVNAEKLKVHPLFVLIHDKFILPSIPRRSTGSSGSPGMPPRFSNGFLLRLLLTKSP
jgi:magnesium transporter